MKTDKEVERDRYDSRAQKALSGNLGLTDVHILKILAPALRAPYQCYETCLRNSITGPEMTVLEIGAGTGCFTEMILATEAQVVATDISSLSLEVLLKRLEGRGKIETQVADMESLPFQNATFDVVTSAGSLSYGDNKYVMNEVYRVLKYDGCFICVDSLNHNPVYRLNRWIQYLRNNRTRSTLDRMPTQELIKSYGERFGEVKDHYFGSITWMTPLLNLFLEKKLVGRFSNRVDELFSVSKSAFKFVMVAQKTKK